MFRPPPRPTLFPYPPLSRSVRAPDLGEPVAPLGVTQRREQPLDPFEPGAHPGVLAAAQGEQASDRLSVGDRKSTRLNSSHGYISYAVFCLKKKKKQNGQVER